MPRHSDADVPGVTRVIPSGCCHDCGGRCVLRFHVRDGVIVRTESDTGAEPQLRACLRGRAYRQRAHSPNRLKYPMRRVGARGTGEFERISWDEALDAVAGALKSVKEEHGSPSIFYLGGSGNQGILHGNAPVSRLLIEFGGYTHVWGSVSYEGAMYASMATFGSINTGHSREDHLNSKRIIIWGWNPADTIWDPGTANYLAEARDLGIPITSVDPRYTNSTAAYATEWIPIRPGTDTAMLLAMAHTIITEGLADDDYIARYTVGFEAFRDHQLGTGGSPPRTPEWAAGVCGVPADVIRKLAREYATARPAALISGWGPGRSASGEQYHRAASTLCAITGNVGVPGGYAGGFMRAYPSRTLGLPRQATRNTVDRGAGVRPFSLHQLRGGTSPHDTRIHYSKTWDAILRGKDGGYPCDPKLAYIVANNPINSYPDTNQGVRALKSIEHVIVHEQFMTPTARFADILLPVNMFTERDDLAPPWLGAPYYIYLNQATETPIETLSDWDICERLASRLGLTDYPGTSAGGILQAAIRDRADLPEPAALKGSGVHKITLERPTVAFREQIADPAGHPFPTPSGKIELYSELLAAMHNPAVPPLAGHLPTPEDRDDPLARKYPLQLLTTHFKGRAHSTFGNLPWLMELESQAVWINTADAAARNIHNGDAVTLFNDRGRVVVPARVTERIMPGVVDLCEGGTYQPDDAGVDHGGCANVLTGDYHSPGGAVAMNSSLIEVSRV